ncbi:MAG TPA: hypothetical protein DHV36_23685, partial [Desulfobacteraceae bacterium]|nr:hypothetical protein [Desulfobacteraceae bacterium]
MTPETIVESLSINGLNSFCESAGILVEKAVIKPLDGGKNNRVYRVDSPGGRYLFKVYAPPGLKKRNRLQTEYRFLALLQAHRIAGVPEPVACDHAENMALYTFIEGKKVARQAAGQDDIDAAMDFLTRINLPHIRQAAEALPIGEAAEACFSRQDHFNCVDLRLARLTALKPEASVDEGAK